MNREYRKTSIAVREPTLAVLRELKRGKQTNDELLLSMAILCDNQDLNRGREIAQNNSYEQLVRRVVDIHGLDYLDVGLTDDGDLEGGSSS